MSTKKTTKRLTGKKNNLAAISGGGAAMSKIKDWQADRKDKQLYDAASKVAQHRFNGDTNINKGDNWLGPVIVPGTPTGEK